MLRMYLWVHRHLIRAERVPNLNIEQIDYDWARDEPSPSETGGWIRICDFELVFSIKSLIVILSFFIKHKTIWVIGCFVSCILFGVLSHRLHQSATHRTTFSHFGWSPSLIWSKVYETSNLFEYATFIKVKFYSPTFSLSKIMIKNCRIPHTYVLARVQVEKNFVV